MFHETLRYRLATVSARALDIKLQPEEDSDLDTDHLLYSFKFIPLKEQKLIQNVVIF